MPAWWEAIRVERQGMRKLIAWITLVAFFMTGSGLQAQVPAPVVAPAVPVSASPVLKGLRVYPNDPFRFDFIIDKGPLNEGSDLRRESVRLIEYFLASLTLPESDLWVNLSPFEKDRIIPQVFGKTAMGRTLLEQDYLLKQLTAARLHPDDATGRAFWSRVYREAFETFGTADIPVDALNKVWIVPDKAVVYENAQAGTVYVLESHLKVMVEADYFAIQNGSETEANAARELSKDVLREVVIPVLEKEVNNGESFIALRQVYQSLILAAWFKKKFSQSLVARGYADKQKISGLEAAATDLSPEQIWEQYVAVYKKGSFNLIREETEVDSGEILPRNYFSGGLSLGSASEVLESRPSFTRDLAGEQRNLVVCLTDFAMTEGAAGMDHAMMDPAAIEKQHAVSRLRIAFQREMSRNSSTVLKYRDEEIPLHWETDSFTHLDFITVFPFSTDIRSEAYRDGLRQHQLFMPLVEVETNRTAMAPPTGSFGRIYYVIQMDKDHRPILIIHENHGSPGFRRIGTNAQQRDLRNGWISAAHTRLAEMAFKMGFANVYAIPADLKQVEYGGMLKEFELNRYYRDVYENDSRWERALIEPRLTQLKMVLYDYGIPVPEYYTVWRYADQAQNVDGDYGGIDFNPGHLAIDAQNSGGTRTEIGLEVSPELLAQLERSAGLRAVVLQVVPLPSLERFLQHSADGR